MNFLSASLKKLSPYVPGEQPKDIANLLKLNTNESPFPPSPKAVKAGKDGVANTHLYSDPNASALVNTLADYHNVSPSCIAVSNGSDEALAFFAYAFCENGMIINDITYGFYKVLGALFQKKISIIKLDKNFCIDERKYANKKGTVFIANPNAPTGIFLTLDKIEIILNQDKNRLVIVDEAYVDFGAESALKLLDKYKNLAVVRTFSKSRSMAGARLGYVVSSPQIIQALLTIKNSFHPYNVNQVTQLMAVQSVKDEKYFNVTRTEIIKSRELLLKRLQELSFTTLPSLANFVFTSPPDGNGERAYSCLREKGILVRYFSQNRLEPFVRITVGNEEQTERLVGALKEIYD